ncbi:MAG: hypothetical protein EOM67_16665 [Spirochaetia bacterium]|nr:hypothetical protein [Spirochaetia bacterium]
MTKEELHKDIEDINYEHERLLRQLLSVFDKLILSSSKISANQFAWWIGCSSLREDLLKYITDSTFLKDLEDLRLQRISLILDLNSIFNNSSKFNVVYEKTTSKLRIETKMLTRKEWVEFKVALHNMIDVYWELYNPTP